MRPYADYTVQEAVQGTTTRTWLPTKTLSLFVVLKKRQDQTMPRKALDESLPTERNKSFVQWESCGCGRPLSLKFNVQDFHIKIVLF